MLDLFGYSLGNVGVQILMTVLECSVNKMFAVIFKYFIFN